MFNRDLWNQFVDDLAQERSDLNCGAAADYLSECGLDRAAHWVRVWLVKCKPKMVGTDCHKSYGWYLKEHVWLGKRSWTPEDLPDWFHGLLKTGRPDGLLGTSCYRWYNEVEGLAWEDLWQALRSLPLKELNNVQSSLME